MRVVVARAVVARAGVERAVAKAAAALAAAERLGAGQSVWWRWKVRSGGARPFPSPPGQEPATRQGRRARAGDGAQVVGRSAHMREAIPRPGGRWNSSRPR